MDDNSKTFQLDDPICIKGEVTPQRAADIIGRMNQLLEAERKAAAASWEPKIYYR